MFEKKLKKWKEKETYFLNVQWEWKMQKEYNATNE